MLSSDLVLNQQDARRNRNHDPPCIFKNHPHIEFKQHIQDIKMKKNNALILKLSALVLIALTSNPSYSASYFSRSGHKSEIGTPEIQKRTQVAIQECREYGTWPKSPEGDVWWSEGPEYDKWYQKQYDIKYMLNAENAAKEANHEYLKQRKIIKAFEAQQEYQRKIRIAQEKVRREEQQRQNALFDQYCIKQEELQKRLEWQEGLEDEVTWGNFPLYRARSTTSNHVTTLPKDATEDDLTSHETSSKDSSTSSTDSSYASSLSQTFIAEFVTDNKENQYSQTPISAAKILADKIIISQVIQKKSRDAMTSERQTSQRAATSGEYSAYSNVLTQPDPPFSQSLIIPTSPENNTQSHLFGTGWTLASSQKRAATSGKYSTYS
jgi:hypothetical protein